MAGMLLLCPMSFAQVVKGKIVDSQNQMELIGATVVIEGTSKGTAAGLDGSFSLQVPTGEQTLKISFVGYIDKTIDINLKAGETKDLGEIKVEPNAVGLKELRVVSSLAQDRKTPIAVSKIQPIVIEEKLGTEEFPEILKSTPSIYATKVGGGYGDAKLRIRGFDSRNIGVLINGVPVNDMENGKVYWSNWAGLPDVTRSIQVQRGIGASKVAISSVGGTINIITRSTDAQEGGSVYYRYGADNRQKAKFNVSTGLMDNGWAVTLSGSRETGDGYMQATNFEAHSYFFNISKKLNNKHHLSLTGFGAPQWHNQRGSYHTIDFYRNHPEGIKVNTDFGYRNGEIYAGGYSYNEFHKPQFSLNHFWNINQETSLSTSIYASFGRGGGRRIDGENDKWLEHQFPSGEPYDVTLKTPEGYLNWDAVIDSNANVIGGGSRAIVSMSENSHDWYGLLSSYNTKFGRLNFTAGFDGRYYKGYHRTVIDDLLGGEFYLGESNINRSADMPLKSGDYINYHNTGEVIWTGLFGQGEYEGDNFTAFLNISVSNNAYKRIDYFSYYDDDVMQEIADVEDLNVSNGAQDSIWATNWSQLVSDRQTELGVDELTDAQKKELYMSNEGIFEGMDHIYQSSDWIPLLVYSVKGGANYNINEFHNVFANFGYFTRPPMFTNVFLNYTNEVNDDIENELVISTEFGYGFKQNKIDAKLIFYRTLWTNKAKTLRVAEYVANLYLDALHQGIEAEVFYNPFKKLSTKVMASIGDWKWVNNDEAKFYNDETQELEGEAYVYAKDVHVGDAAQTTFSLSADYEVLPKMKVGADFYHYDNIYANFDIEDRTNPDSKGVDTWMMPSYQIVNAFCKYRFKLGDYNATLYGNVHNLLDTEYIADAYDGTYHDAYSSYVYYGFGRTWSLGFKLKF